jgi:hypothetical protein
MFLILFLPPLCTGGDNNFFIPPAFRTKVKRRNPRENKKPENYGEDADKAFLTAKGSSGSSEIWSV